MRMRGQMMKTFYAAYSAWQCPGHAVFAIYSPKKQELYARLYGAHQSVHTDRRAGVLEEGISKQVEGLEIAVAQHIEDG